ncbi:hypothetical protein ACFOZY_03820 [Chungangia koreensis]|uniref:Uncharacterized protein n=1 Tax=Chungangia koreensis TaxID=752657 RepID=A0ABV8X2P3_9LACT
MDTCNSHPAEAKIKAVEMREAGIPVKEVVEELNIKNKSQILRPLVKPIISSTSW